MIVSELLARLAGVDYIGAGVSQDAFLKGGYSDSRQVGPDDLFIALPGVRSQGVDYLEKVFATGCRIALVPSEASLPPALKQYCIGVTNIRQNAAQAACAIFGDPTERLLTFGVTGTNGKTSTCHILKHLLEAAGHRVVMLTTVAHEFEDWRYETPNTTPDAALLQSVLAKAMSQGATAAVVEVSAHGVLLDRISGSRFDGLVFTNLSLDHQDFFDGMEPYFAQKLRLFTDPLYHKRHCVAVIGIDDRYGRRLLRQCRLPALSFGESASDQTNSDREDCPRSKHISVDGLTLCEQGLRGILNIQGRDFQVNTSLTSAFNRLNIAGAAALAMLAELSAEAIEQTLSRPIKVPGRLMKVNVAAPFQVIVDFAHTDSAMSNLLTGLRKGCQGRLIVVFGAGGDKDPARRYTLPQVVIDLADVGVITLDNPRSESPQTIIEVMVENWHHLAAKHSHPAALLIEPDRQQAIELALAQAEDNDIVVLAGKGHETTQTFADRVEPHDDHAIAAAWLTQRFGGALADTLPDALPGALTGSRYGAL